MNRKQQGFGLGIVVVLLVGLAYAGLSMSRSTAPACQICRRAVHKDMRTVAFVGDEREIFCCPTCALSAGAQLHKRVRFEELSDFVTGRVLRPASAFAVKGSDLIPCVHKEAMLDHDGQPAVSLFDRCSPSIIAFADRRQAVRFAAEHGGSVDTFSHLTESSQSHLSR